jgi:hypothetical protein
VNTTWKYGTGSSSAPVLPSRARRGIVLAAGRRGPAGPYSDEYAQRKVREARKHAGLGDQATLDACRLGGLTELGDAGASEFEGKAASMHKTPQALRLYVKHQKPNE